MTPGLGGGLPTAVLLDRDGTLNAKAADGDYVKSPDELRLLPGAADAVAALRRAGIPAFVVTNQRGVALGRMTASDVDSVNRALARQIKAAGGALDGIYTCPHGDGTCECRKPQPGLLHKVAQDHPEVLLGRSVLVGDALADLQAAAAAGVPAILVGPDRRAVARRAAGAGVPVSAVAPDLAGAVALILDGAAPAPRRRRPTPRDVAALAVIMAVAVLVAVLVNQGPRRSPPPPVTTPPVTSGPPAPVAPSAFQPLPAFAPDSLWKSRVDSETALDPSSRALVATLAAYAEHDISAHVGPWINTTQYSVPVYTVPAGQPLVPVTLDRPQPYAASLKATFAFGVPIPHGAQPAAGTDRHMVIWRPSTETMWEFWRMTLQSDGWHAQWGGKMTHVSTSPGYFTGRHAGWGAAATGLPLTGGLITPDELRAGVINHALALAVPGARAGSWASPAQRTDGTLTTPDSIPEGAHFRLNPTLNLAALALPRPALILARAAQKYGIIVRDRSGVVTFYAQDPSPTGSNPYPSLFGRLLPSVTLARFPWSELQLLPMDLKSTPQTTP